jgi:hypothetical protein
MLGARIAVVLVIAAGTRAADRLRVRQQEVVLSKLPVAEAHDYYQVLVRRTRRARLLRAIALAALLVIVYTYRRQLIPRSGTRSGTAPTAAAVAHSSHA